VRSFVKDEFQEACLVTPLLDRWKALLDCAERETISLPGESRACRSEREWKI
jgi:hypothetical protein